MIFRWVPSDRSQKGLILPVLLPVTQKCCSPNPMWHVIRLCVYELKKPFQIFRDSILVFRADLAQLNSQNFTPKLFGYIPLVILTQSVENLRHRWRTSVWMFSRETYITAFTFSDVGWHGGSLLSWRRHTHRHASLLLSHCVHGFVYPRTASTAGSYSVEFSKLITAS
jgi:hypothetical protein